MAEVLLFHHAQGLTDGVRAFAARLELAGHTVHLPDLYAGSTFATLEEGIGYASSIGFGTIMANGVAAADGLGNKVVYAGFSLGVGSAQQLAQTRPAAGALFLHACFPVSEFSDAWPANVPVQIHGMDRDPFFADEGDLDAARELVDSTDNAELFLYEGDSHLFTDSSLDAYDEEATELVLERVLSFLARVS